MSEEIPVPANAPELSVRTISMALLRFVELRGRARLEEVWREHGFELPLSYVETLTNFVSLGFVENFIEVLRRESGDPNFLRTAGLKTASREALGFLFFVLKAVGTPRLAYLKTVELNPTYNRVGTFSIERVTETELTLRYQSRRREANRNLCEARMGQFASVPTIWGMPPAEVKELECHVHGAPACRYALRWQNPPRAWRPLLGAGVGALVGVALGHFGLHPAMEAIPLTTAAFGLAGALWHSARDSRRKDAYLLAQNEGLMQSLHELERRHEEVVHAQRLALAVTHELEARVEARTRELSEANTQLAAALERQREIDRRKTEFFDNVSHELRTPLSLILVALESLAEENGLSPRAREHLQTMERSGQRLLRLIDHLLDLAKLESGKLRLRYQPIALGAFLRSIALPFQAVADEKKLALKVTGELSAPIHADPERLEVIFQNLLSNAIEFTTRGSIALELAETPERAVICVRDTGEGIAERDLPSIFDRFAQADARGVRRFGGTGIGLALARDLVQRHGGTISVQSQVGVGTTFRVELPKGDAHLLEAAQAPVVENAPSHERLPGSGMLLPAPALPEPPPNAPRVMIVEDDPELRGVLRRLLGGSHRVLEAENGEQALALAKAERPDLVLTDVMMPRVSGLQLVQALRATPELAETPIILLTARQGIDETVEGLTAGANDFVGKPFHPRELLARIDTQLKLREAAAQLASNERLTSLGMMSSGFAHEVRNPLNGLLNALGPLRELLDESGNATAAADMVWVIDECAQRMRVLAESLLSFARPSSGDELLDIPAALDRTLKVLAWKLPAGIRVERRYLASARVRGDAGALNQVWLNLLDNALRAMGDAGTLTLSVEEEPTALRVSVRDTGAGISAENLKRLFQPFFTTRKSGEGTGLGLALSRRIVAGHGGKITVESEPGRGSRFSVVLPLPART